MGEQAKRQQPEEKQESFWKWLLEVIILAAVIFTGVQLLFTHVLAKDVVSGPSMQPTFYDGDRLITSRLSKIKRGDVVVLEAPDEPGSLYIKRVIGLPGDTVTAKGGHVYVNGKRLSEPYLKEYDPGNGLPFQEDFTLQQKLGRKTVPANSYFVMGDNRPISKDSRRIGFIKKSAINGVVKLRYWPLSRLKFF
ncbi:signal peptidase I [Lapidilactobacillus achengensis]|uniref:Signal peptidase I n=1 Tax=Lapidilactobacillus achengensis TaxID=2486000 RepID=A0ABW1ULJ9_9LACO|nr:signal peptidase I [Lapidilactobacillus achengensis]